MSSSLDFDLKGRVDQLKKGRGVVQKPDLKKKLEEERAQKVKAQAERQAKEIQEKARLKAENDRLRAEEAEEKRLEEIARSGGVTYKEKLRSYPISKADTNRVILPPSALEKIMTQRSPDEKSPLTFKLSLVHTETGEILEETYSGVEDFTAEEGTIGIPPKTALSLTKEHGLHFLNTHRDIIVQYILIDTASKSFMRVQPRGKGFHKDKDEVVNIDIKSVLERTLQDHFVIAKGDWIPLVHKGERYELVVRELEPESVIVVVNTDLAVDIMPSEDAMKQIEEREMKTAQLINFKARLQEIVDTKRKLIEEKSEPASGKGIVTFRVRLPKGANTLITRRFDCEDALAEVFDWVYANLGDTEPPKVLPDLDAYQYPFELVQLLPGSSRVFAQTDVDNRLKGLGFIRSGESLTARWLNFTDTTSMQEKNDITIDEDSENEWRLAAVDLEKKIEHKDESMEPEVESFAGSGQPAESKEQIVSTFKDLLQAGVDPIDAEKVAKLYSNQIQELREMGLGSKLKAAVPYLLKYNGRLVRVTNALFNEDEENDREGGLAGQAATAPPISRIRKAELQEKFNIKYAELISTGISPEEAAAQALRYIQDLGAEP